MASQPGRQSSPDRPSWEHRSQPVPVSPPRPQWEESAGTQQEQPTTVPGSVAPLVPSQLPPPPFDPPIRTAPAPSPKRHSAASWILASVSVVIVSGVLAVFGFLTPGWFVTTVLDPATVREGVARTLHDEYKLGAVESVWCPEKMAAEQGLAFRCEAEVAGKEKMVLITIKDQHGTYEVGYPA